MRAATEKMSTTWNATRGRWEVRLTLRTGERRACLLPDVARQDAARARSLAKRIAGSLRAVAPTKGAK